jgi:hypothetical protein
MMKYSNHTKYTPKNLFFRVFRVFRGEIFVIVLPPFLLSSDNVINILPEGGRIHF